MPTARRLLILIPVIVAGALLPGAAAQAAFGPLGSLNQLAAQDGCVHEAGQQDCRDARAMDGIARAGADKDRTVIFAPGAGSHSVAVLRRDAATGTLSQSSAQPGCVAPPGNVFNCRVAENLEGALAAAVSPDSLHVYVATANGIAAFDYKSNPETGGLVPLSGANGCISNDDVAQPGDLDNRCGNGRALAELRAIAVSPDGQFVYAAVDSNIPANDGVVILKRDPATGNLSQGDGALGCVTAEKTADGDSDIPGPGSQPKGCGGPLRAITNPRDIAVSRDNGTVYVATSKGVVVLKRAGDGALTQSDDKPGCIVNDAEPGCEDARALGSPYSLALSTDGLSLYVASVASSPEVAHLLVAQDGKLSQPNDTSGCISDNGQPSGGTFPCAAARSLTSATPGIAVSGDGATVAVGGDATIGEVALLDRSSTGGLSQAADKRGCVSNTGAAGGSGGGSGKCLQARGVGTGGFFFSPGSDHFYAAGGSNVAFLRREVAPTCNGASAATDTLTPVTIQFTCSDLNGDAVGVSVVGAATKGTAAVVGPSTDKRVSYTPAAGSSGLDTFLVRPFDGTNNGPLATATVNVTFKAGPPPPPPPPEGRAPHPTVVTRTLRPDAKGRVRVSLRCPSTAPVNCRGKLQILTVKVRTTGKSKKKKRVLILLLNYDVAPGKSKRYQARLSKTARKALKLQPRGITLTVETTSVAEGKLTSSKRTGRATLKRK